jgi:ADP-ribose pyrophosphatase
MAGMTNANMKLIVLDVILTDQLEIPGQKLEAGEFIVRRVVQLSKLSDELKGTRPVYHSFIVCA